jgi:hypothetical protein
MRLASHESGDFHLATGGYLNRPPPLTFIRPPAYTFAWPGTPSHARPIAPSQGTPFSSDNLLFAFLALLAEGTKVGERPVRRYIAHVQRFAA